MFHQPNNRQHHKKPMKLASKKLVMTKIAYMVLVIQEVLPNHLHRPHPKELVIFEFVCQMIVQNWKNLDMGNDVGFFFLFSPSNQILQIDKHLQRPSKQQKHQMKSVRQIRKRKHLEQHRICDRRVRARVLPSKRPKAKPHQLSHVQKQHGLHQQVHNI